MTTDTLPSYLLDNPEAQAKIANIRQEAEKRRTLWTAISDDTWGRQQGNAQLTAFSGSDGWTYIVYTPNFFVMPTGRYKSQQSACKAADGWVNQFMG